MYYHQQVHCHQPPHLLHTQRSVAPTCSGSLQRRVRLSSLGGEARPVQQQLEGVAQEELPVGGARQPRVDLQQVRK